MACAEAGETLRTFARHVGEPIKEYGMSGEDNDIGIPVSLHLSVYIDTEHPPIIENIAQHKQFYRIRVVSPL